MFQDVLADLRRDAKKSGERAEIVLGKTKNKTAISLDKFLPIAAAPFAGTACFVDGGNAPVYESPDSRVELVRVYGTIYDGKKRTSTKKEEGFLLIQNVTKDGNEFIEAKGYAPLEFHLLIAPDDAALRFGQERVTLATVASLCRFMLECRFAAKIAKENDCELLIRDGSLDGMNSYEENELGELLKHVKNVVGFSKTTTMLTADGESAAAALLEKGPKGTWSYPLGELGKNSTNETDDLKEDNHLISLFLLKLHGRSEHAFRCDIMSTGISEIISYLASVAADPVFPGYPYPLIEADRLARVSNQELATAKMRFQAEAGASWAALQRGSRGSDAHGILDRIG